MNDTIPYMLAFQRAASGTFALAWLSNLGQAQVNLLGSASPVVRRGILNNQPEVYSASFQGAVALVDGRSCPSSGGYECGPTRSIGGASVQGSCNCATGVCSCGPLVSGLLCFQGPGCGDTCSGNGVCREQNVVNSTPIAVCACSACWSGATCSVYTCGGGAAAKPYLQTPAGAAAVGVPVALVLALGLALAWWRVVHPKAPWGDALPRCSRAGGGNENLLSVRDTYAKGGYGSVATTESAL